jgi:hypothetical protein
MANGGGSITFTNGANGSVAITPNGTGRTTANYFEVGRAGTTSTQIASGNIMAVFGGGVGANAFGSTRIYYDSTTTVDAPAGIAVVGTGTNKYYGFGFPGGGGLFANTSDGAARVTAASGAAIIFGTTSAGLFTGTGATITEYGRFTGSGGFQASNGVLSTSPTLGIGYTTGSGGTISQSSTRSTGVTVNTVTGTITGNNSSLAASTAVSFTVTDSTVAADDVVVLSQKSGTTTTIFYVSAVAAGSFQITEFNENLVTADTTIPVINFAVIKGSHN